MEFQPLTSIDVETSTPAVCPHCGYKFDVTSGEVEAGPGDITICMNCVEACFFNSDMSVRIPSVTELLEIDENPEIQRVKRLIRASKAHVKRTRTHQASEPASGVNT